MMRRRASGPPFFLATDVRRASAKKPRANSGRWFDNQTGNLCRAAYGPPTILKLTRRFLPATLRRRIGGDRQLLTIAFRGHRIRHAMIFEKLQHALSAALRQHLIVLLAAGAVRVATDFDDYFRIFLQGGDSVVQRLDRIRQQFRGVGREVHALQLDLILDGATDRVNPIALGRVRTLIDRVGHAIAVAIERRRRRGGAVTVGEAAALERAALP